MDPTEPIVTEMTSTYQRYNGGPVEGHWHWEPSTWSSTPIVSLRPPEPGNYGWNCQCPQPITHGLIVEGSDFKIGKRLAPPHRDW
jgi:hypothetical protein